ncbi:hypothetical protein B0H16DRAFT_1693044 [Mycena metata]|uniref:MYND-type domain-containing protein n=1 Tax=Mycena metata TaxID=1033252 RepID=A0AAD7IK92_9AGAR|nr:hypothetical protein B0H16DRAFT_1693044 [Mycena metata]
MSSNPGASKRERALLISTLLDPMHPDSYCVLGVSEVLDKVITRKEVEHDARQGPVLRAAMIFVSTLRTEEEHAAIRARLLTCTCKSSSIRSHRPVFRPLVEVPELVLFEITSTISDYFMRIGARKFARVKENTPADARPWPSCIEDVIPAAGGQQEVLMGLVQWAAIPPSGHTIRTSSLPTLGPVSPRDRAPKAGSRFMGTAQAARMPFFIAPVTVCAHGFFHTLSEIDLPVTLSLLLPVYEEMYPIAVEIEPILLGLRRTQNPMDDCRRWFGLVRRIRNVVSEGSWVIPKDRPEMTDRKKHFAIAFNRMVEIRNRNQCLYIECTTKIHERLYVCSRCGIVRYCSKVCLAAAWDAPNNPHKALCKNIAALRTATLLKDDKAWSNTVRDSALHRSPAGFADMCTMRGADPDLAAAIWRELVILTDKRMRFVLGAAKEQQMLIEGPQKDVEEEVANESPVKVVEAEVATDTRLVIDEPDEMKTRERRIPETREVEVSRERRGSWGGKGQGRTCQGLAAAFSQSAPAPVWRRSQRVKWRRSNTGREQQGGVSRRIRTRRLAKGGAERGVDVVTCEDEAAEVQRDTRTDKSR